MKQNSSNNTEKSEIKIHSSKFFENCKKLKEIVKLSNLKKITKENTYLSIISFRKEFSRIIKSI